jgi:DNA polymerase-3 subunit alpha
MGIRATGDVPDLPEGAEIKLGGLLAEYKDHTDRNGRPMAFASLEDLDGTVDLVVFPDAYERAREELVADAVIVVQGRLSGRNGRTSVQVEQVLPVEKAREMLADGVNVMLPRPAVTSGRLEDLKRLLQQHPGDCAVYLHLEVPSEQMTVVRAGRISVCPSEPLFSAVQEIVGEEGRVWVSAESVRVRRAARRPRVSTGVTDPAPDRSAPTPLRERQLAAVPA